MGLQGSLKWVRRDWWRRCLERTSKQSADLW